VLADGSPEMRAFTAEVRSLKQPPRDLVAVGVAVLSLLRPEVTRQQLLAAFGAAAALPAGAAECGAFWRDWAHNALVEFGDSLMTALQVAHPPSSRSETACLALPGLSSHPWGATSCREAAPLTVGCVVSQAVDYRVRDGKLQRFEALAALLDSVHANQHRRYSLIAFVFPWLRCVLALHKVGHSPGRIGELRGDSTVSDSWGGWGFFSSAAGGAAALLQPRCVGEICDGRSGGEWGERRGGTAHTTAPHQPARCALDTSSRHLMECSVKLELSRSCKRVRSLLPSALPHCHKHQQAPRG
jgi:hypothetical protein